MNEGQVKGTTQQERLDNWYTTFKHLLGYPPTVSMEDEDIQQLVYAELPIRTDPFVVYELLVAINQLKNGKACGEDGIPAEVIKYCNIQDIILHFCNESFSRNCRLEQWNKSNIIPFLNQVT